MNDFCNKFKYFLNKNYVRFELNTQLTIYKCINLKFYHYQIKKLCVQVYINSVKTYKVNEWNE